MKRTYFLIIMLIMSLSMTAQHNITKGNRLTVSPFVQRYMDSLLVARDSVFLPDSITSTVLISLVSPEVRRCKVLFPERFFAVWRTANCFVGFPVVSLAGIFPVHVNRSIFISAKYIINTLVKSSGF